MLIESRRACSGYVLEKSIKITSWNGSLEAGSGLGL
jgi:hypothetical protein